MRITTVSIMLVVLASGALAAEPRNAFVSNDLGISIEAPIAKDTKSPNYQIAMFFLPASDNFAANVNVQKQQFREALKTYDKLTMSQFRQFNMTVLNRMLKGNDLRYEYKGDMQGRTLHWYARAIKTEQHVYLVTATSLDSQCSAQLMVGRYE
ncbi:MAG: hypothetical protein A2010_10665 [Nitrospirae bacterium GWD2_57_9]|nr:MAG: hypothetical protein A2010_10665 [Nitrospirae bacterium GWD2_57_9]